MPARAQFSGTWLVIAMVAAAAISGALTWKFYRRENPTSVTGELVLVDGSWRASAAFAARDVPFVKPGAGVIITSPAFPQTKMSGTVATVTAEGQTDVALNVGPPADTKLTRAPSTATVDSATAP